MFYNERHRTKYERMLCLKNIISIIIHEKKLSRTKIKKELFSLSQELNIEITKLTKLPKKWKAKRDGKEYSVLDMRDSTDAVDNLFIIKWIYQPNMNHRSEEAEMCLINIVEKPDYDLIPILKDPLAYSLLKKTKPLKNANFYKVLLDNFKDLYFEDRNIKFKNFSEKACKLRTSVKKAYGFTDNDSILLAFLSIMKTKRIRTKELDFRFSAIQNNAAAFRNKFKEKIPDYNQLSLPLVLLCCLQPHKRGVILWKINHPRFLYEFQKSVFNIAKKLNSPAQDRDELTKEYLQTELLKIFKKEKRLKYERLLCIQTLFSLFYSETKDENKTLEQLKKVGIFLQNSKEFQNSVVQDGIEVIDMREEEKYPWNKYFYCKAFNMPYTKEHFLIHIAIDEKDSHTDTIFRALEKFMMLVTPVADEFSSSDFAFFVFDNFHKIFDFKGETVNLTERLFQEVKARKMHFGKNIKAEKTCESQRIQNLFTKLLKPENPRFLSYGFHKHIETANDLLKNVFSAFFIKPAEVDYTLKKGPVQIKKIDKSDHFLGPGLKRNQQFITHIQKSSGTVKCDIQHPKFIYLFQKYLFDYIKKGEKPELLRNEQVTNFETDP
ncbi:hypothetical protein KA996_08695 [bacterium]|nr:hypothetical protein [bacterium]